MIQTLTSSRGSITTERKRIRVRAAARRLGIQHSYLSASAKPGGILERDGVTVIRYPTLPDVVEFYEDEIIAWWQARHPEWIDAGSA